MYCEFMQIRVFFFINMQMSVLPCRVGFKIYSRVEVIWSFYLSSYFSLFLLKNSSALEQHNILLHEKCRAQFPLDTITVWLGSRNPYRVTKALTEPVPPMILPTSDISRGAGVQPAPWTRGHGCGICILCRISPPRSCWSFHPCSMPARACPSPNCRVVWAESSTSAEFGSFKCLLGANTA